MAKYNIESLPQYGVYSALLKKWIIVKINTSTRTNTNQGRSRDRTIDGDTRQCSINYL